MAVHPGTKTKQRNRVSRNKVPKDTRGVIYVGRLNKQFFEKDLRTFFSQFGKITRLRVSRSKRTSHSKGYAFIEFELEEVARIVSESTNNHFISGRPIKVEFFPKEKVHDNLFETRRARMIDLRKARRNHTREEYNDKEGEVNISISSKRVVKKLEELGIHYELPQPSK